MTARQIRYQGYWPKVGHSRTEFSMLRCSYCGDSSGGKRMRKGFFSSSQPKSSSIGGTYSVLRSKVISLSLRVLGCSSSSPLLSLSRMFWTLVISRDRRCLGLGTREELRVSSKVASLLARVVTKNWNSFSFMAENFLSLLYSSISLWMSSMFLTISPRFSRRELF